MNYTLTQRDADFMSAVRKATATWSGHGTPTVAKIVRKVINGEAPEFYVNYETAYRYVGLALRGCLPMSQDGIRRQQWNDIAERVRKVMTQHPDYTMGQALVEVIDAGKAPSFYMSYATALSRYYRLITRQGNIPQGTLQRNRDWEHK